MSIRRRFNQTVTLKDRLIAAGRTRCFSPRYSRGILSEENSKTRVEQWASGALVLVNYAPTNGQIAFSPRNLRRAVPCSYRRYGPHEEGLAVSTPTLN